MSPAIRGFSNGILALVLAACGTAAMAADWIDMGALSGSVQGHVWSKVIDQTGRTTGRNESWQVTFAAPAIVEIRLRCPDGYPLDARVQSKNEYGEVSEYLLDRVAGGFHKKFSSPWNPRTTRDVRVLVSTRQPGTDQRYQLTLNLFDVAGKPLAAAAAPASRPPVNDAKPAAPGAQAFLGTWLLMENGAVVEYMQVVQTSTGIELTFLAPDQHTVTSRVSGRLEGKVLTAASAKRKVRIVAVGGKLDYTSSNHDGSAVWNGQFTRK